MQIHSLTQGTPEWHAHRLTHWNASDAPAMMGCSPYETRTQLIHRMHTGIAPDIDAGTQARFDEGHRIEALARAWAEEHIFDGEFLYPIVGSEGKYSASFDGLLDDYSEGFEHKTLNDELRKLKHFVGQELPLMYRVQMEQQLMICGGQKCLFMASKWDGDTLIEERHCWYAPDLELRAKIIAGWAQLEIDKAAYVPTEIVAEAVGRTPETLPALHIVMKGEISASNMDEFKHVALAAIRSVNRDLKTDQDFADSAKARKWCEDIESRVAAAKDHALGQTKTIDDLFRTMDEISAEARDVRLALEKLEKARKESRRGEIVAEGIKALADHVAALNTRLGKPYMPATACDFGGAIKGLRTFDSMQNAVDTALANAKIAASATADRIDMNLDTINRLAGGYTGMFPDAATLVLKAPEDFEAAVMLRVSEREKREQARLDAERDRIRAEEQEKAEREARAKLAAEQAAADKLAREQALAAKRAQDAIAAAQATPAPAQVIAQPVPSTVTVRQVVQPMFTSTPVLSEKPVADASARAFVDRISPPTMSLGAISSRLGFAVTSQLLSSLGFEATTVKAAKMFHSEDFQAICRALIEHIESVSELQAA